MYRVGIDLGGTKIEGVLLNDSLDTVKRQRIPTPNKYHDILDAMASLVERLTGGIKDYTVGVGTPGTISDAGLLGNCNILCLANMPLVQDLEAKLKREISIENDANCFALAEATMGCAQGFHTVFGAIMGTGIGGGIVIDGQIHCGSLGVAGEWGHHILYPHGNPCYCGRAGCVETYISGPALEREWLNLTGRQQTMPEIIRNLDSTQGRQFKERWLDYFGMGLATVIDILDPDVIVLGGGLSNVDFLYSKGRDRVYENVFSDHVDTPILKNSLGDSAGVFGAAVL